MEFIRTEMDFQVPQGTRLFPSIRPEWLNCSTSDFILMLQRSEIFTLTKGKLLLRMTFHQESESDPPPPVQRLLDAVTACGNKRVRDELDYNETGTTNLLLYLF